MIFKFGSFLWWFSVAGCICNVFGLLPQVSQEGLLRPYRNYADVTLFHYYVPTEVTRATFEFAAFMDNPGCAARDVYIYLQHGSYPVFSAYGDNSTFPPHMFVERTSMFSIVLHATYQPQDTTRFPVYDPLPGNWFASAYLPDWDQNVQQEGIGHKCQYSLGSIALWTQVPNVETVPLETTTSLSNEDRFTYLKFYITSGTWEFTLKIDGCQSLSHLRENQFSNSNDNHWKGSKSNETRKEKDPTIAEDEDVCIKHVFLRGRALPTYNPSNALPGNLLERNDSYFSHVESLPEPDSYYYLLIVTTKKISYNISITTRECQLQILGKSFLQHFSGVSLTTNMKEQAIRMNFTNGTKPRDLLKPGCQCVPIFRLTRIKHAQDFSDTFLLEGKEWFTTWVALTEAMPVGASFEILPFVDIGGTLSISVHMDELLLNATTQIIQVMGCIRKSSPPEPLCCASENISDCCPEDLTLHISSTNLSTVDDYILIPYPEPDIWYISFTTICYYQGKRVPCVVKETLISLDVRTQPCVLTKPSGQTIYPCGQYGLCQEVHKGQFFYTSCHCIGGYRGWACSDDSHATSFTVLVTTTLLLTLSNIFFIPAIILAVRRRMFTQVLVYFATMVSSTLYHACDQDIYGYCLTRYQVLQFCDFFCSILAFWVTLIALAKSPPKYDSALYVLGAVVIAIGVEYNRTGLLVFIVPFCLGIGIPVSVWTYRSIQARSLIKPSLSSVLLFTPGVLLGGAGLILFAFVETEDNYRYTHSAWHVIIALSLVYLLPKQQKKNELPSSMANGNGAIESNNTSELAAVSDYQVTSSSPVFFVTSDLDHLVQEPNGR